MEPGSYVVVELEGATVRGKCAGVTSDLIFLRRESDDVLIALDSAGVKSWRYQQDPA